MFKFFKEGKSCTTHFNELRNQLPQGETMIPHPKAKHFLYLLETNYPTHFIHIHTPIYSNIRTFQARLGNFFSTLFDNDTGDIQYPDAFFCKLSVSEKEISLLISGKGEKQVARRVSLKLSQAGQVQYSCSLFAHENHNIQVTDHNLTIHLLSMIALLFSE